MALTLQPGFLLEQFTLRRPLGRVLGAQCWLAEDGAGQHVHVRLADDPEVQIVFREQAATFEALLADQPAEGIARLRHFAPFADLPHTVEDYIDGARSLAEMLREMSPLPGAAVGAIFVGLVRAVMHLHQAGIAHGAIRPENVFVHPDGGVRLAGLGWGRLLTVMLRRGALAELEAAADASLAYFAPEQRDQPNGLQPAADIHALGVLLFEMATGLTPEKGQAPSALNTGVPDFADVVCRRCLDANPAARFGEAGEILHLLRSAEAFDDPTRTARDTTRDSSPPIAAASEEALAIDAFAPPVFRRVEAASLRVPAPVLGVVLRDDDASTSAVEPFAIAAHLVTAHAFALFLRETRPPDTNRLIRLDDYCTLVVEAGQHVLPRRGLGFHPVNQVSWLGATRYCEWLARRLGGEVRLPTAAEWLTAAGFADGRTYPWGEEPPSAERACYGRRWCDQAFQVMVPVESLPGGASPCGALQMSGTLWEWTSDSAAAFVDRIEEEELDVDPAANGHGPAKGNGVGSFDATDLRVICGGSWYDEPGDLRLDRPRLLPANYRRIGVGFRVAAPLATLERLASRATAATPPESAPTEDPTLGD